MMMTQCNALVKAVITVLDGLFRQDKGDEVLGVGDGFPVGVRMAVDDEREGGEYVLVELDELEELVDGWRTYHAVIGVTLRLSGFDRTADEVRVLQGWLEERLWGVDRDGLNEVELERPYRSFLVIGDVRVGGAYEVAAEDGVWAVSWRVTVPVQF